MLWVVPVFTVAVGVMVAVILVILALRLIEGDD
jgi:hypothetical protein